MCRNVVLFPKIFCSSCELCEKKSEITVRDIGRFVRVGIEYKSDKSSQAGMYVCAKLFKNIQENYAERVGRANSLARLINVELKSRLTKC